MLLRQTRLAPVPGSSISPLRSTQEEGKEERGMQTVDGWLIWQVDH